MTRASCVITSPSNSPITAGAPDSGRPRRSSRAGLGQLRVLSSGPGPDFKSGTGNLAGGDTYKQTFSAPGTITYTCTIRPGMDGKIIVK